MAQQGSSFMATVPHRGALGPNAASHVRTQPIPRPSVPIKLTRACVCHSLSQCADGCCDQRLQGLRALPTSTFCASPTAHACQPTPCMLIDFAELSPLSSRTSLASPRALRYCVPCCHRGLCRRDLGRARLILPHAQSISLALMRKRSRR